MGIYFIIPLIYNVRLRGLIFIIIFTIIDLFVVKGKGGKWLSGDLTNKKKSEILRNFMRTCSRARENMKMCQKFWNFQYFHNNDNYLECQIFY